MYHDKLEKESQPTTKNNLQGRAVSRFTKKENSAIQEQELPEQT